jgi:hypothetical protein
MNWSVCRSRITLAARDDRQAAPLPDVAWGGFPGFLGGFPTDLPGALILLLRASAGYVGAWVAGRPVRGLSTGPSKDRSLGAVVLGGNALSLNRGSILTARGPPGRTPRCLVWHGDGLSGVFGRGFDSFSSRGSNMRGVSSGSPHCISRYSFGRARTGSSSDQSPCSTSKPLGNGGRTSMSSERMTRSSR